jgi:ParB family chromosome partitioning protein
MNTITVNVMTVRDYEHQLRIEISENENRKEFTFSERIEWAKRLEQVERIKAKEKQESGVRLNLDEGKRTDEIVAKESGFGGKDTYRKAKFILENADDDLIKLLDEKQISVHAAYQKVKKEKEEAENKYNIEIAKKETELNELKNQIKTIKENKNNYQSLRKEYDKKVEQLNNLEKEIKSLKIVTEEEKYAKKLKDSAIFFCARVNDFIEKTGGFVWLSENINELPEFERKSYIKAIEMVENWATAMKMNMKNYLN